MPSDLSRLTARVIAFRDERDWKQFHKPKDLALALNIEAGELAELFLWKDEEQTEAIRAGGPKLTAVADELADILIYSLLLAEHYDVDLARAVESKLEKNARKYPVSRAKGNAKKYTELAE